MSAAIYINDISTARPQSEVQHLFLQQGPLFLGSEREKKIFKRMADKSQIESRYSVLPLESSGDEKSLVELYQRGKFPSTRERMRLYQKYALPLALQAIRPLQKKIALAEASHVIITSCTGFYAPGLDIELVKELGMKSGTSRSIIGFMGCYAAFNGLRTAQAICQAQADAKVLMVNLELCSLHFQEISNIESMLGFLLFADGCAASWISRENQGLEIQAFRSALGFEDWDKITWQVGDHGFDMHLSTEVPASIARQLPLQLADLIAEKNQTSLWAIHPGGRAILDVVEQQVGLSPEQMLPSREILRNYGNMSSASVMYVLEKLLYHSSSHGQGWAMAFGPGLTMEAMKFNKAAQ